MSLDDLRKKALDADDDPFSDGYEGASVARREVSNDKLFGLNPVERMFLSIAFFLVVSVLSFLILLLSDSIALP